MCRGQVVGRSVKGVSNRIAAAMLNSSLVREVMLPVGAWSQAPAPVPLVEWWTAMARASRVLLRSMAWLLRTSEVSCFVGVRGLRVGCDLSDFIPQRRVDIEGGGVELSSGVG